MWLIVALSSSVSRLPKQKHLWITGHRIILGCFLKKYLPKVTTTCLSNAGNRTWREVTITLSWYIRGPVWVAQKGKSSQMMLLSSFGGPSRQLFIDPPSTLR